MTERNPAHAAQRAPAPDLEPLEVTDENFGDLLVQSAKDALAYVRGEQTGARVRMRAAAEPALTMPPPEAYDAARIHGLRVRLGLTQQHFANALNVSDKTVKAWEQGINVPSGPALRLLQIAERQPEVFTTQRPQGATDQVVDRERVTDTVRRDYSRIS